MTLPVVWEERCLAAETDCSPDASLCSRKGLGVRSTQRWTSPQTGGHGLLSCKRTPCHCEHVKPICEHHVPIFCFACRTLGRSHSLTVRAAAISSSLVFHTTSGLSAVELGGLRVICGLCTGEVRRESMASVRARFHEHCVHLDATNRGLLSHRTDTKILMCDRPTQDSSKSIQSVCANTHQYCVCVCAVAA